MLDLDPVVLPRMSRTVSLATIRREWPPAEILLARSGELAETDGATAARWLRAAGRMSPDDADVLNSAAWVLLTMPDAAHHDPVTALDFAREAVRLSGGEDHMILDTLGLALFETGHLLEAIEVQEKAVRMAPGVVEYRERLLRFRARVFAG